ncbi:XRE family transcriptional regulator [Streptomyces sp. NPDC048275]|uniref:RICIN domain-containing protein n=1 Tax=Streptomyces sp. NPDC048275 TaxID=3155629 RepID=UPI0033CC51BD
MEQTGDNTQTGLTSGAPKPDQARTPADFIAALRKLRTWSELTYRQLEQKAAAQGDTLHASTIATALGRSTLPREPLVAAFTRACGLDEDHVRSWLDARRRLSVADQPSGTPLSDPASGTARNESPDASESRSETPAGRRRRQLGLVTAVAVGAGAVLGIQAVLSTMFASERRPSSTDPVQGLAILDVGSWAQIHPARTPKLCLTEGRDRTRSYSTAIAAQFPCTKAVQPRTYVEPIGENTVQIQWHHPKYGIGCLTVLIDGPGRDLVEPRDDCAEENPAQRFRLEPIGPPNASHFRIRPAATEQCLALRDQDMSEGTEIVQGRCSGARDQEFLIELRPPS